MWQFSSWQPRLHSFPVLPNKWPPTLQFQAAHTSSPTAQDVRCVKIPSSVSRPCSFYMIPEALSLCGSQILNPSSWHSFAPQFPLQSQHCSSAGRGLLVEIRAPSSAFHVTFPLPISWMLSSYLGSTQITPGLTSLQDPSPRHTSKVPFAMDVHMKSSKSWTCLGVVVNFQSTSAP